MLLGRPQTEQWGQTQGRADPAAEVGMGVRVSGQGKGLSVISTIKERNNNNIKIAALKVLGKCEHAAKLTSENNDFQIDFGNLRGEIQGQKINLL